MNSALAKEQLRIKRLREMAAEKSKEYEDKELETTDSDLDKREAEYQRYKKAATSHTATGISLLTGFRREISKSLKNIYNTFRKILHSNFNPYYKK